MRLETTFHCATVVFSHILPSVHITGRAARRQSAHSGGGPTFFCPRSRSAHKTRTPGAALRCTAVILFNSTHRFEELNTAFVRIVNHFKVNKSLFTIYQNDLFYQAKGENVEDIMPGEVDVKKALFVMQLKKGSVSHWRRVIKTTYPTVIIGAQKRDKFIPGASGRGIRQQQIRVNNCRTVLCLIRIRRYARSTADCIEF